MLQKNNRCSIKTFCDQRQCSIESNFCCCNGITFVPRLMIGHLYCCNTFSASHSQTGEKTIELTCMHFPALSRRAPATFICSVFGSHNVDCQHISTFRFWCSTKKIPNPTLTIKIHCPWSLVSQARQTTEHLSSPWSLFQSESKCEIFVTVISSNFNNNENWYS